MSLAFRRQHHVPRLAGLGRADGYDAGIRVEVGHLHYGEFRVPAAGQQGPDNEITEIGLASVYEPSAFYFREIAHASDVDLPEWLHSSPSVVARHVAGLPGVIEGGL
jgi:hypothetical protein